jgi:hypothetical protein
MAAICQTLPGMYRPRFETSQILAALLYGRRLPHAEIVRLHVSISTA